MKPIEPMKEWIAWRPIGEIHEIETLGKKFLFAWFTHDAEYGPYGKKLYGSCVKYPYKTICVFVDGGAGWGHSHPTHFIDIDQFDL